MKKNREHIKNKEKTLLNVNWAKKILIIVLVSILTLSSTGTVFSVKNEEVISKSNEEIITTSVAAKIENMLTTNTESNEVALDDIAKDLLPILGKYIEGEDDYVCEKIKYLVAAEAITKLPYIEAQEATEGELVGRIKIYRYLDGSEDTEAEDDILGNKLIKEEYRLTYKEQNEFATLKANYEKNGDEQVFRHFTMTDEEEIVIAYGSKETRTINTSDHELTLEKVKEVSGEDDYTGNADTGFSMIKYRIREKKIDYLSIVGQYIMPANLLFSFLIQTKNIEFVEQIAALAYESEIAIGIYDNDIYSERNEDYTFNKTMEMDIKTSLNYNNLKTTRPVVTLGRLYDYNVNVPWKCEIQAKTGSCTHTLTYCNSRTKDNSHQLNLFVKNEDNDGKIIAFSSESNAEKFVINYKKIMEEKSTPTVGVILADTWVAKWTSTYSKEIEEKTDDPKDASKEDLQTEEFSNSTDVLNEFSAGMKGTVNAKLKNHADNLKKAAIEKIIDTYSSEITLEEGEETTVEELTEKFEDELENQIKTNTDSLSGNKNYVNINYSTSSYRRTSKHSRDGLTERENEGEKFSKVFNDVRFHNAKLAVLQRTEWFWTYIRENEDTAKLEDLLRYLLNIATDSEKFGKFTEEEIEKIFQAFKPKMWEVGMGHRAAFLEWIKSYENNSLRRYMKEDGISYEYVQDCITEDREYGKMYFTESDGCWNFTYGIMVCNKDGGLNNQGIFEEYGYDLEELVQKAKAGETVTVPMEDLEAIYEELVSRKYQSLRDTLKEHDVTLETWQNNALVSFCYQWGNCGQYIQGENNIAEVYKKYYVEEENPEAFRNNAVLATAAGRLVHFFNDIYKQRQDNAWIMFHEGRYILNGGEEIYVTGDNAELILDTCAWVAQDMLDNGVRYYSRDGSGPGLAWNDIARSSDYTTGIGTCCATYVGNVLYRAQLFSESYINKYNYNLPGCPRHKNSIYGMLLDAGWELVEEEEAQPGDICAYCKHTNDENDRLKDHAFIYAGGNLVWDQNCGTVGGTGEPRSNWKYYIDTYDVAVFRAP